MKKIVRLTETDLIRLVKRIINESSIEELSRKFDWDFPENPDDFSKYDLEYLFQGVDSVNEANELIADIYPGYKFVSVYQNKYGNQTIKFISPDGKEIVGRYLTNIGGSGYLRDLENFRKDNTEPIFYSKYDKPRF